MSFLGVVSHLDGVVLCADYLLSPEVVLGFFSLFFSSNRFLDVNMGLECPQLLVEYQDCILILVQTLW